MKNVQPETSRETATQAMADHMLNMPPEVYAYAHEQALKVVYDGDEAWWKRDDRRVTSHHPRERLIACRYYLYYEVYSRTIQELAFDALRSKSED